MKTKEVILTIIMLALFCNYLQAQEKVTYYKKDVHTGKIAKKELSNIKEIIKLEVDVIQPKGIITASSVITLLIPFVVKNVSKLFYNPSKYIKESGATISFLKGENRTMIQNSVKIIYVKEYTNSNTDKGEVNELTFKLSDSEDASLKYKILELTSAKFNLTNVKLKEKYFKTNVVIDITFNYYDKKIKEHQFKLKPILLGNIEQGNTYTFDSSKVRLIPPMRILESLEIKITEVNSRKKDWDKWLKLYNDKQDKVKDYLLKIIDK